MSLVDGPLTGAPLGIPNSSLSAPNITLYDMVTPVPGVGVPEATPVLIPIFESPVEVSGDFSLAGNTTLTCQNAGRYLVAASIAVVNDNGINPNFNKQANLDCAVNGVGNSAAVVRRAETPMYDLQGRLRRTLAIPVSTIALAVGDEVQFYFSYQGTGGDQTYTLNIYSTDPGAIAWAQLERIG